MASSSASSLPGSVITVVSSPAVGAASSGPPGTGSPCAACKFLRRKCQPDCVFAPYFPPDNPQKFVHVHRVFGASNVTKLLHELNPYQREDAVNSLAYEADMRLRDPVYGCVGVISVLQHQLRQLQQDLSRTRYELSKFQGGCGGGGFGVQRDAGDGGFHRQRGAQLHSELHQHQPLHGDRRGRRWVRARPVRGRADAGQELRGGGRPRQAQRQRRRRLRLRVLISHGRRWPRSARRRVVLETWYCRRGRAAHSRPPVAECSIHPSSPDKITGGGIYPPKN